MISWRITSVQACCTHLVKSIFARQTSYACTYFFIIIAIKKYYTLGRESYAYQFMDNGVFKGFDFHQVVLTHNDLFLLLKFKTSKNHYYSKKVTLGSYFFPSSVEATMNPPEISPSPHDLNGNKPL